MQSVLTDSSSLERVQRQTERQTKHLCEAAGAKCRPQVRAVHLNGTRSNRQPGRPQQNGRHERMHLTLKKEATKPLSRQYFISEFNVERPHEALEMKTP